MLTARPRLLQLTLTLALVCSACAHLRTPREAAPPFCATEIGSFEVHDTNSPHFGTPIATGPDGSVYICYIDRSLQTVVRQYQPASRTWTAPTVLAPKTSPDKYHTQCALGQDALGYVHVVGNMHSTPWQYWRSTQPHAVAQMTFLGQDAGAIPGQSNPSAAQCTGECAANWGKNDPGIAAIPGNQVTYPHFARTLDGRLFLGFRECLICDASYHDKQWSAGLVEYHASTQTWTRVEGIRPWATEPEQLPVGLRLAPDHTGRLHASWVWCQAYSEAEGGAACFEQPNFVSYGVSDPTGRNWTTSTGQALTLPLSPGESEVVSGPEWFDTVGAPGYYAGKTEITVDGSLTPTLMVFPDTPTPEQGIHRAYVTRTGSGWTRPPTRLEYAPSLLYRDRAGRWIAVSSGLKIHVSTDDRQTWTYYPLDTARGSFDFAHDEAWLMQSGNLRLYAHSNPLDLLVIWSLQFLESGTCAP